MSSLDVPVPITETPLHKLVQSLSRRPSPDIEKVVIHLLDTANAYWGERANTALRAVQTKGLSDEEVEQWREEYNLAFAMHHDLSRMRYGLTVTKRSW